MVDTLLAPDGFVLLRLDSTIVPFEDLGLSCVAYIEGRQKVATIKG